MTATFKYLLAIAGFIVTANIHAQDYSFKDYNWDDKVTTVSVPKEYQSENEVILERHSKMEIFVEGAQAQQFYLLHEKVFINSDDAIERNNRVYIPFSVNERVLKNKVRVLLKSGKVITLDEKDVKEEVDEEKGVKYNYFAVNGLEKGAVIEKLFVLNERPELDGKTFKMQSGVPIANLTFELIHPDYLVFKSKSYNGLSNVVADTTKKDNKTHLFIRESNIAALNDDEKYSNRERHLKIFRYKLDSNKNTGGKNLYNYRVFATNIYELLHPVYDKKEQKAISDFAKTIPVSNDKKDQIWHIESAIKKNIIYDRYLDHKESLVDVFKSKQANQRDILKLYTAMFSHFNIENNLVFTSNRYEVPFDAAFESYENLSSLLFYFPEVVMYLSPTEIEYRIPMFPAALANTDGLFVKEKEFAGTKMGIGEVKFIEIPGVESTHDTMEITIDFTKDLENPIIRNKISFGGYSAMNFQPVKDFIPADQYQDFLKTIAQNYTVDTEYQKMTTENDGLTFIGKKPFVLDVSFEGRDLIQKAGNNYLFSIGQIIGKQMELYQEEKRTLPVEIDYPHSYLRRVRILLPEGVTVKNLDKLAMAYQTNISGKKVAEFTTTYDAKPTEITIENVEYYNIVNYPLANFEEYRAVINAAADFNKVVLVLSK
ncbi:MAG TPA: hypothetical protein VFQ50_11660 [Flavobacterium sp.]|jgi:hypothetical protein|nr:hypothetical protein [Flavobacterium sp.]